MSKRSGSSLEQSRIDRSATHDDSEDSTHGFTFNLQQHFPKPGRNSEVYSTCSGKLAIAGRVGGARQFSLGIDGFHLPDGVGNIHGFDLLLLQADHLVEAAGLRPGASPPLVQMPMLRMVIVVRVSQGRPPHTLLAHHSAWCLRAE